MERGPTIPIVSWSIIGACLLYLAFHYVDLPILFMGVCAGVAIMMLT